MHGLSRQVSAALVALAMLPVAVGVSVARSEKRTVEATGTVVPKEVVDIGAMVAGRIIAFGTDPADNRKIIDFGSRVKKGTVLTRLDPTLYELDVAGVRAELAQAQAEVKVGEANLALAKAKFKSEKDAEVGAAAVKLAEAKLLDARATVEKARVALRRANQRLEYCTIRSLIDGVILDRRINLGQRVRPDLDAPSLFVIATDLEHMQVWAMVNEADISRIHVGQKVTFKVAAYPKDVCTGRVIQVRLNASMVKGEVKYTVVVEVNNKDGKLLPYMTAQVQIDTTSR